LLATIYVAIVVPFNASFPDTFNCNAYNISFNDSLPISDDVISNIVYSNDTSTFVVVDDDQKKRFVVLDVIVETIFILGE
jgi:hypothetical protein